MEKDQEILSLENYLKEFNTTKDLCAALLKAPHYSRIGAEGIFAIIETAKSLGIDPRQALGGGLYYVKGKVEMSARLMNALIRSKKHSITKDKKSDATICILHGKRADTSDTWCSTFTIEEAKRAGLTKNLPWQIFPEDMLFARALSRLARQLFPDVIGNCYVESEISLDNTNEEKVEEDSKEQQPVIFPVTEQDAANLETILQMVPDYHNQIKEFMQKQRIEKITDMPRHVYDIILNNAQEKAQKKS